MTVPRAMANLCGAETRKGSPCGRPAGWGTSHPGAGSCKLHTGATPAGELHGQILLARRDMIAMGAPLPIEPHEAILECIRITAGEVLFCSERIAELELSDLVGPVLTSSVKHGGEVDEETMREGAPTVHVWIAVRRTAMDRLVAYSAAALRAGIEERRVRIAEDQAQLLAQAVRGIMRDLGVEDRPDAPAIVRRHLTMISGMAA